MLRPLKHLLSMGWCTANVNAPQQMLFDVFEWLCLYALINPTGPRVVLMYIMHVQSAHFPFFLCLIFCCVQNGNNPSQIMSCMLEYVTVLHTFENLACVFRKNLINLQRSRKWSLIIKICIKPFVYDYFDSYDYNSYFTAISFNL